MANKSGTTLSGLEHYFGTRIGIIRVWHRDGDMDEDFEACKEEFINNLKRVISEDLPEEGGVTNDSLEELVELARDKDLSKIKSVKDLYTRVPHRRRFLFHFLFPIRSTTSRTLLLLRRELTYPLRQIFPRQGDLFLTIDFCRPQDFHNRLPLHLCRRCLN